MATPNDPKNSDKKANANAAQKLRDQLLNRISELSDDELSQISGGTTPVTDLTVATLGITTIGILPPVVNGPTSTIPTLNFAPN